METYQGPLQLGDRDRALLAGEAGEAMQFAMQVVVRAADIMGASQAASPGIMGDLQRGIGGVIVDVPGMLVGAPLAIASQSLTRISGASTFLKATMGAKGAARAETAIQVGAFASPAPCQHRCRWCQLGCHPSCCAAGPTYKLPNDASQPLAAASNQQKQLSTRACH